MLLERIDHFAVNVKDLERSAEWYRRVLGLEIIHKFDGVFTRPTVPAAPVFHARPRRRPKRSPRCSSGSTLACSVSCAVAGADPRSPAKPIRWPNNCRCWRATPRPRFRGWWPAAPVPVIPSVASDPPPRWWTRTSRAEGFSLHANVAVPAHAREGREHLCRYLLRPPLALERLTESSHGQLLYELAHPRADGATHLLLDPLELLEKLAVLAPVPRTHLLRYHGVLAPSCRLAPADCSAADPGRRRRGVNGGGGAGVRAGVEPLAGEAAAFGAAGRGRAAQARVRRRRPALSALWGPPADRGHVHTRPETRGPLLERLGLAVPAAAPRPARSPPASAG